MTLTTQDDFNKQLSDLDRIQATCQKLLETPHYKKLGVEGIHFIMARAKVLGIDVLGALNGGFINISGKFTMTTEMMAALVRSRGHSIQKDPKSTSENVILHGKRKDNGDSWTCSFSKEDALAAGLWNGPTWKKYPTVMLYNRAMSMLFRQLFPDLSLGAGYCEDELKEITRSGDYDRSEPMQMADAEFVKPKFPKETLSISIDDPEPKPVKPIVSELVAPHQAEELKCLRLTATDEARSKIDKIMLDKGFISFEQLPSTGYLYVRDILLKSQEPVKEEEMVDE